MILLPFRVYDGDVSNVATKVFGGKSSGIRDWDKVKYPQVLDMNREMSDEFWTEDEVKLGKDIEDYREKLSPEERRVFNILSGKLNWLDSIATDFNFILAYLCTDSSIRTLIALINYYEILHNRSYQYLIATVITQQEKEDVFESVRHMPRLVHRNNLVIEPIQNMVTKAKMHLCEDIFKENNIEVDEKELMQAIFEGVLANMCLEGLYFSGGFVYFHSLARDQKMIGSNNMINLIKTDENQHSVFFGFLFQILISENPLLNTPENLQLATSFIQEAVQREKEWSSELFENIDTLSIREYHDYVEYLANLICRNAGMPEAFPENQQLKSKWIATYGSKKRKGTEDEVVTRIDFLQGNAINYAHESGEDFDI